MSFENLLYCSNGLANAVSICAAFFFQVSRFCDIEQLLSLCVVIPREETTFSYEKRLNNVIGLRHALDLVDPLKMALECAESQLLSSMRTTLEDNAYSDILSKVGSYFLGK